MISTYLKLKLAEKILIQNLLEELKGFGFKYLKGKQLFKRQNGNYLHIISFGDDLKQSIYDEQTGELYLKFYISITIKSTKFDKWVLEKYKQNSSFTHFAKTISCIELLDYKSLNLSEFLKPAEIRTIQNFRSTPYTKEDKTPRISLIEFKQLIPEITSFLDELNSGVKLFKKQNSHYLDYLRLLVFDNELEQAEKAYLVKYNELKNSLNLSKDNASEFKSKLEELGSLSKEIESEFNIKVDAPIKRELSIIESKHKKVKLADDLGFQEIQRFDTTLIDIASYDINDLGETLIVTLDKEVIKIESTGMVKKIGQLHYEDCFDNYNKAYRIKVQWIKNANTFACNNYILSDNDELIELKLDFDKSEFKINEIEPYVQELYFDSEKGEYHILFSPDYKTSYHMQYDKEGQLIHTNKINRRLLKLNLLRKEYIASTQNNSVDTLDFQGNILNNYKYNNGNQYLALSPNGKILVLHFYSTKSQLYDLERNRTHQLWAHPTYTKNYLEKHYKEQSPNFGMTHCSFSPDGKHIIGGGEFGKYVFWDTDKFDRQEMIPTEAAVNMFSYNEWGLDVGAPTKKYFRPYTVEYENQKLFINRSFNISDTYFIDNGKYIITQIRDCLLVWNSKFENIGHVYGIGKVIFSNNYLIYKTKNELIIQKRVSDFIINFESSVYKEKITKDNLKLNKNKPEFKNLTQQKNEYN